MSQNARLSRLWVLPLRISPSAHPTLRLASWRPCSILLLLSRKVSVLLLLKWRNVDISCNLKSTKWWSGSEIFVLFLLKWLPIVWCMRRHGTVIMIIDLSRPSTLPLPVPPSEPEPPSAPPRSAGVARMCHRAGAAPMQVLPHTKWDYPILYYGEKACLKIDNVILFKTSVYIFVI